MHETPSTGEEKIVFSCPVCGRKSNYPIRTMVEGALINCSFCKLTIRLHGHMWQDVQREIQKIRGRT